MMSQTVIEDEEETQVPWAAKIEDDEAGRPEETQAEGEQAGLAAAEVDEVDRPVVVAHPPLLSPGEQAGLTAAEARSSIIEVWKLLESYAHTAATWLESSTLHGCCHLRETIETFCVKVCIVTSQLDNVDVYRIENPHKLLCQLQNQAAKIRRDYMALKPTAASGFNMYDDKPEPGMTGKITPKAEKKEPDTQQAKVEPESELPFTATEREKAANNSVTKAEASLAKAQEVLATAQAAYQAAAADLSKVTTEVAAESEFPPFPPTMPPLKRCKGEHHINKDSQWDIE